MKNFDATSKKFSWPYPSGHRLLHSPSLVAVGLSVGYWTWPPIGWHHSFLIGWSKDRFGLPSAPLHYGRTCPVGIPTVFQTPVSLSLLLLSCDISRQAINRHCVNSLWPSDAIWRQRNGSTLNQVMACCLMAPSHYLNQYWFIIGMVQWLSSEGNFRWDASAINQ